MLEPVASGHSLPRAPGRRAVFVEQVARAAGAGRTPERQWHSSPGQQLGCLPVEYTSIHQTPLASCNMSGPRCNTPWTLTVTGPVSVRLSAPAAAAPPHGPSCATVLLQCTSGQSSALGNHLPPQGPLQTGLAPSWGPASLAELFGPHNSRTQQQLRARHPCPTHCNKPQRQGIASVQLRCCRHGAVTPHIPCNPADISTATD
mmetsp:Transcript_94947/g.163894  ORF Transcript_94947/g.163894 Transcript_94947/m.163894 type:complete len:203 (-) Transcript_94947:1901-2509(-)